MPDQNGTGNQNGGGPVNPFQPNPNNGKKADDGKKSHVSVHGSHDKSKIEHKFPVKNKPLVEHKKSPDKDTSTKPVKNEVKTKVEPINPFAPASVSKTSNAIEGEVMAKKPDIKKTEKPNPFEKSKIPDNAKLEEPVKVKETNEVKVFESVKGKNAPKKKEIIKKKDTPAAKTPKVVQVDSKSEEDDPIGEFRTQIMDILDQAGITKGTLIKTGLIIVAAVFVILGYVYGWYGMIVGKIDGGEKRIELQEQESGMEVVDEPVVTDVSSSAFGVVSAYIFGLEFNRPVTPITAVPMTTWGTDAGVRAASILGMTLDQRKIKFVEYVSLLRKLQNIYNTDVYALLDMSVDRRAALQQHINELVYLLDSAGVAYNELENQLVLFDNQYDPIIKAKDAYETNFFNSLYAYYGESAYVNLGMFVETSQNAMEMKAYFNAYKTLKELFAAYINALKSRYSDISVNTEALIKGIRVFSVPNSDIRTIIKLGE